MKYPLAALAVVAAIALCPACDAKDDAPKTEAPKAGVSANKADETAGKAAGKQLDNKSDGKADSRPDTKAREPVPTSPVVNAKAPEPSPQFPPRTSPGTPFVEEHLLVSLKWKGPGLLTGCPEPEDGPDCKTMPAPEAGDKLKYTETTVEHTPRIVVAKAGGKYSVADVVQKEGDTIALYGYAGEGTCEVAAEPGKIVFENCPNSDTHDGFAPKARTDETQYSKSWVWWVKVADRWVKFDDKTMKVVKKSAM